MEPKPKPSLEPGPGALLREAREERGLSIEAVAHELRLSPRLISALEQDAYDRLPGPTYVRGYLRNYAQFLRLPPQRLIDAYNNRPEAAQRTDMTAPVPVRQATSGDAMMRFGSLIVAAIVLGLAVLWWHGDERPASPARPAPRVPASQGTADAPPVAAQPAPPPPTPSAAAPAVSPAEKPAAPAVNSAAANTEASAAIPPIDPDAPRARLVLHVHQESWADVRDAQQRRLLYETIPAGRVVTVEGIAPLSIFLGNVAGVTVEFNGQPYDALRHKRGEVARFTLGGPRG